MSDKIIAALGTFDKAGNFKPQLFTEFGATGYKTKDWSTVTLDHEATIYLPNGEYRLSEFQVCTSGSYKPRKKTREEKRQMEELC